MSVKSDVCIGNNVIIYHPELVNLYGCKIGDNCKIATFVEIQTGVEIGKNCKIEAFAFICTGVTIGDGVFIGPHVCFTNDKYPRAINDNGELLNSDQWTIYPTIIEEGVSIGANSTIVCGIKIGKYSKIGAGSVVTKDVPERTLLYGNPAR